MHDLATSYSLLAMLLASNQRAPYMDVPEHELLEIDGDFAWLRNLDHDTVDASDCAGYVSCRVMVADVDRCMDA